MPGKIVLAAQWTQTASRNCRPKDRLTGRHFLAARPRWWWISVAAMGDFSRQRGLARGTRPSWHRRTAPGAALRNRRANQRGLTNIRFAALDCLTTGRACLEPGSVAEIHCYHPQPYYDPGQVHRRLVILPDFCAGASHAGARGKVFRANRQSRLLEIHKRSCRSFSTSRATRPWPDAPKGRTRREIIAMKRGLTGASVPGGCCREGCIGEMEAVGPVPSRCRRRFLTLTGVCGNWMS